VITSGSARYDGGLSGPPLRRAIGVTRWADWTTPGSLVEPEVNVLGGAAAFAGMRRFAGWLDAGGCAVGASVDARLDGTAVMARRPAGVDVGSASTVRPGTAYWPPI